MKRAARSNGEVITLSLPSRLELLPVLDRLLQGIAEQMEFDEDMAGDVAISIIEAGTNAMQHGHRLDPAKVVEFRFDLLPDQLLVEVVDRGPGFNLEQVLAFDPDRPEDLLKCSGRGIYIMRKMMDEVVFDIDPSRGTRVSLRKARPAASAGARAADR